MNERLALKRMIAELRLRMRGSQTCGRARMWCMRSKKRGWRVLGIFHAKSIISRTPACDEREQGRDNAERLFGLQSARVTMRSATCWIRSVQMD